MGDNIIALGNFGGGSGSQMNVAILNGSARGFQISSSQPSTSRGENSQPAAETHNECITMWEPVHLKQEWTISNFKKALDLASPGICLRSRCFKDSSMPDINWQLCLYPGGKREENIGHVSLFLKMAANQAAREFTVRAEYRFYFLDDGGVARFSNVNTGDFKVKPQKSSHSWGLRNIPRSKVDNCIRSDGSLRILCQIELVPDFNKLQSLEIRRDSAINSNHITKQYLNKIHEMFENSIGTDCMIQCGMKSFDVHKFILMAHSEVFRAMFSHKETKENVESRIDLMDTSPVAVQHMLTYMYSGSISEDLTDEEAPLVMEIAEKYGLDALKILCQQKLIPRLNKNNVCAMLELADTHNAPLLMDACIPIICINVNELMKSDDWKDLRTSNLKLVNGVLEKVVMMKGIKSTMSNSPPSKRARIQDHIFLRP
uniref:Speckle-type POZ protein n=1 Tax=Acrobeloides nanus TaxID=290746 RepID=A0A914DDZ4_9BILA